MQTVSEGVNRTPVTGPSDYFSIQIDVTVTANENIFDCLLYTAMWMKWLDQ